MKETWKILNGLINKKRKGKQISTKCNGDESKVTGDKSIANGFNNLFVNICPSLVKRIPKCNRPLSRRLDRCDRVIQDEFRDPFGGNVY